MTDNTPGSQSKRRPIRVRDTRWAAAIAQWLARTGLTPNQISVLSIVFSVISGACLLATLQTKSVAAQTALFIAAAACIQLRLLCNLFDGMVAVEHGQQSKSGEIYNELPDRISDAVVLVCAGFAASQPWSSDLGWAAATLAVITAYVRTLGGQAGASQQFCGPMAKQQRMFLLTAACLFAAVEATRSMPTKALQIALLVIVTGCVLTIIRRTIRIIRELEQGAASTK